MPLVKATDIATCKSNRHMYHDWLLMQEKRRNFATDIVEPLIEQLRNSVGQFYGGVRVRKRRCNTGAKKVMPRRIMVLNYDYADFDFTRMVVTE